MVKKLAWLLLICLFIVVGVAHAQERGTLRLNHAMEFGGLESIDPLSQYRYTDVIVRLYNRLVRADAQGLPAPELATEWNTNDDATEWTFVIREGVQFHDGKTLTATDVAYSFNRVVDPTVDTPVRAVLGIIDRVEAVDDRTARFILSAPHADFPLLLTDYRALVIADGSAETIERTGNGTGPFRLETLDLEGTTVLTAFDSYWEGVPKHGAVELFPIPDATATLQAMLAGQIDIYSGTVAEIPLFPEDQFYIQYLFSGGWEGMVMRTDTPPFDDLRVRRALRLVADRQAMIDLALGANGGSIACDSPVWPGDPYYLEMSCPQDIDLARQLLAEAGYADGITIDLYLSDLSQTWTTLAEVYQQQAAEAGITVNLNMTAADGYWSDVWMIEPFTFTSWGQRPADQILNEGWRSGADWNETYWNRPDFDSLLDRARSALDFTERTELYAEAQEMLWLEGGALIPYFTNTVRMVNNAVTLPEIDYDMIPWWEVTVNR
jgi:peptide/nickel transport system substrate-binding protein